jgi:hypothetical protein
MALSVLAALMAHMVLMVPTVPADLWVRSDL